MNIDQMPAGRELDAHVAEKVMGWTWGPMSDAAKLWRPEAYQDRAELRDTEGMVRAVRWKGSEHKVSDYCGTLPIPRYSINIAAALEVVEKFHSYMLHRAPPSWNKGAPYLCQIELANGKRADSFGDTMPVAICIAALKAVAA